MNLADKKTSGDQPSENEIQMPEVDEFFKSTLRLTAEMIVGLNDEVMTQEKRQALAALAMQLANKIVLARGGILNKNLSLSDVLPNSA